MIHILPVLIILGGLCLGAQVVALVWDTLVEMYLHPDLHPSKIAARAGVVMLCLAVLGAIGIAIRIMCLTIAGNMGE